MSIKPVLYKSLGLPLPLKGKKLSANHNELTRKVDGNTDSNGDGRIDGQDKNGFVETHELLQEVFSNPQKYEHVIKQLRESELEDPFEITPKIKEYTDFLIEKHKPKTKLETAILFMRATISPDKYFFHQGKKYYGLTVTEGGLAIPYDKNDNHPLRKKYGSLLPKEILGADQEQRNALCLEYAFLLTTMLRSQNIKAAVKNIPRHAYTIASIDGKNYRIDGAQFKFMETNEKADADSKSIAVHYGNEGSHFSGQKKTEASIKAYQTALLFDPSYILELSTTYYKKASNSFKQSNLTEAIDFFKKACDLDPDYKKTCYRFFANAAQDAYLKSETDKAIEYYDIALSFNSRADGWWSKGRIYYMEGNLDKAEECFNKSLEIDPKREWSLLYKARIALKQGDLLKAEKLYHKAIDMENSWLVEPTEGTMIALYEKEKTVLAGRWLRKSEKYAKQGNSKMADKCRRKAQTIVN